MNQSNDLIERISGSYVQRYKKRNIILPFNRFLNLVQSDPVRFTRNSAQYLLDAFDHFGSREVEGVGVESLKRYKIFDIGTERSGPIIGGEGFQSAMYNLLESFQRSGYVSKLIMLHGPNGSAKSSTVETLAHALQKYSHLEEGAIYRFNWIFPADKDAIPRSHGESQTIGFGQNPSHSGAAESFAMLDELKIASKLTSEFKENPLYLIPMPYREKLLREWIANKNGEDPENVELPKHILGSGLSKMNQEIFENLLNAYDGSLEKVFRHIQIERFFFSKQYRIGISTVEPQMSIDAQERQLTLDKNYTNMPSVLQTISFSQSKGELVEANRGILEFSDMLKRPVESFKYLLSTIEKGTINLASGTTVIDSVFIATTNEKHLDAFKTIPDFSSFKGRFELIKVPYVLKPSEEEKIYFSDIQAITKIKNITPFTLKLLCTWAVMTRLKQPNPENFPKKYSSLITRLDPRSKVKLFEKQSLQPTFSTQEQKYLEEMREAIWNESRSMSIFEGRFGASPREIRSILYRAAQNNKHEDLSPMAIFEELKLLTQDKTVYEFLQFEPRSKYHDVHYFIESIEDEFVSIFESELVQSMAMADEEEYDSLLKKYMTHAVASIKKERIWDEITNSYVQPSMKIIDEVEKIIGLSGSATEHRAQILSRIASYKIENPDQEISVSDIFADYLQRIKEHYFKERKLSIEENTKIMLLMDEKEVPNISKDERELAENTYENMRKKGFSNNATIACIKYTLQRKREMNKQRPLIQA